MLSEASNQGWPLGWWYFSPVVDAHLRLAAPFFGLFNPQITLGEFFYLLVCGLWELAVWAFFGGAITPAGGRGAGPRGIAVVGLSGRAMRRASGLRISRPRCFRCSAWPWPLSRWRCSACLLRSDIGLVIAGALWFLVLLAGLFMAVLLVGLFFGFPLMWATISAEGTDAFDALSRSYAYTYQRPLLYVLYSFAAGALGMLGWIVVGIFTSTVFDLGAWGVSWCSGDRISPELLGGASWGAALLGDGTGSAPLDGVVTSSTGKLGLGLISFWMDLVVTLAMAFVFSYFWTATTAIYFLLRRNVDATEMDEVYILEEDDHGLPTLDHDAAGVAGAADAAPQHGSGEAGPNSHSD